LLNEVDLTDLSLECSAPTSKVLEQREIVRAVACVDVESNANLARTDLTRKVAARNR
jgi:hypothetical protein